MPSTAAWSAASLSPRPIQRALLSAAASVTRTSSSARLRSGRAAMRAGRYPAPPVPAPAARIACDSCQPTSSPVPTGGRAAAGGRARRSTARYHDEEWGRPVHDADALFERLCLEAFQSGLSWLTILRKREAFRTAFAGFRIAAVAEFGPADVERLLGDAGIVRNRAKIEAAIANARAAAEVDDLGALIWSFAPDPRRAAGAAVAGRRAGDDARVDRAGQGAQAARLPLRRADHRVRAHAGVRPRQRPSRGLLGAVTGFARLGTDGRAPAARVARGGRPAPRARPPTGPFVLLNMVASADGRAALEGRTRALGSDADTLLLTELRALADAVLIGVGTLRAEGYARLVADPGRVARRVAAGRAGDAARRAAVALVLAPVGRRAVRRRRSARADLHGVVRGRRRRSPRRSRSCGCRRRRPAAALADLRRARRARAAVRGRADAQPRAARRARRRRAVPDPHARCSPGIRRRRGSWKETTLDAPLALELAWVLRHDDELYLRYRHRLRRLTRSTARASWRAPGSTGCPSGPVRAAGRAGRRCAGRCRRPVPDPADVVAALAAAAEPGPRRQRRPALLRLRHRRLAARGAGRRLAHVRLGPEQRASTSMSPAAAAAEETVGELGQGAARPARRRRRRA